MKKLIFNATKLALICLLVSSLGSVPSAEANKKGKPLSVKQMFNRTNKAANKSNVGSKNWEALGSQKSWKALGSKNKDTREKAWFGKKSINKPSAHQVIVKPALSGFVKTVEKF